MAVGFGAALGTTVYANENEKFTEPECVIFEPMYDLPPVYVRPRG
jgi:hypothetical protein